MKYLLDTNICVYWLNGNKTIEEKAVQVGLKHVAISFITLSELYYGAYKSQKVQQNLAALKNLESKLSVNSSKIASSSIIFSFTHNVIDFRSLQISVFADTVA